MIFLKFLFQHTTKYLWLCFLVLSPISLIANETLPLSIKKALSNTKIPAESLGFHVTRVGSTTTPAFRYGWNENLPMNPASTIKLLTTLAALDILGPQYHWKTQLYTNGVVEQGILNGNLIWRGAGDPKLVPELLAQMMLELRQTGLNEINGDLIFDRTAYASSVRQSAPLDGEPQRTYNVIPDPLLFAFQTLSFKITQKNNQASITYTPRIAGLNVVNQLQVIQGNCADWAKNIRIAFLKVTDQEWRATFAGSLPSGCPDIHWNSVAMEPNDFLKQGILAAWADAGGLWKKPPMVIESELPDQARALLAFQGTALIDAVKDINKFSNNVMSRQLMLTLALEKGLRPVSTSDSIYIIKEWLRSSHLHFPELVVENGSGLSNIERISARSMTSLLQYGVSGKNNTIFINSLPIAGVDGTMKNRLIDRLRKLWSQVRSEDTFTPNLQLPSSLHQSGAYMKTGTLKSVRAVAGYVVSKSGKVYAVSSNINHPSAALGGSAINDAVIHWVLEDCPP